MTEWKEYIYRERVTDDGVDGDRMGELVRCRECIYKQGRECTRFADIPVYDEDYCSKGERNDRDKKR